MAMIARVANFDSSRYFNRVYQSAMVAAHSTMPATLMQMRPTVIQRNKWTSGTAQQKAAQTEYNAKATGDAR
ncbi:hypothetical protein RugamoR1_23830 [Rugamonas sp. R1(2021)]